MRIAPTGSLPAIRSPSSTAGTFASIMPSVVPRTTGAELIEPGGQADRGDLRLVADLGEKEGDQRRQESAGPADRVAFVDAVGNERPHRDSEKRQPEHPAQPGSVDQVAEQRAANPAAA